MRDSQRFQPQGTSLYHAFLGTAARDPGGVAWIEFDADKPEPGTQRAWQWSELVDRVQRAAAWLSDANITSSDRVVNSDRNSVDWAVLDLACSAIGAIHAPLDPRSPAQILHECARQLEPKLVFACDETQFPYSMKLSQLRGVSLRPSLGLLKRWERETHADDVANILFTSGTTNEPKGAMLTHGNLVRNASAKLDAMPQHEHDVRLNFLPFAHAYARTCELSTWILAGGTMACAYGLEHLFRSATTLQPTLINGVPSFYDSLHQRLRDDHSGQPGEIRSLLGPCIRRLASGGAPMANSLRHAFAELGLPIYQGYGLTEASPVVCSNRAATAGASEELRGVGSLVEGVKMRIDSDDRIWVSGTGVMKGYWNDPSGTAEKIQDGWLDTGDIAARAMILDGSSKIGLENSLAAAQPLEIAGRVDDLQVLTNGYKFLPQPIEQRIAQLPEIERCVLIGNRCRSPVLLVRLNPSSTNASPELILSRVREALDGIPEYAIPREVKIDPQPWGIANGRLHWKGGVDRRGMERLLDTMR